MSRVLNDRKETMRLEILGTRMPGRGNSNAKDLGGRNKLSVAQE